MTLFLFEMVFMDTTATIPTGTMAERWDFRNFIIYGFWVGMFPYAIYGNWVWGGGWLAQLGQNFGLGHGAVDFAGSGVVHMCGGMIAPRGRNLHRAASRQIRPGRQAARHSRPRRADGHARNIHSGLRLVRVQPRLDPRRHGPPHRDRRGEHDARGRRCLRRHDAHHVSRDRQARSDHAVQRPARGPRRHHRAVRVREYGRAP